MQALLGVRVAASEVAAATQVIVAMMNLVNVFSEFLQLVMVVWMRMAIYLEVCIRVRITNTSFY